MFKNWAGYLRCKFPGVPSGRRKKGCSPSCLSRNQWIVLRVKKGHVFRFYQILSVFQGWGWSSLPVTSCRRPLCRSSLHYDIFEKQASHHTKCHPGSRNTEGQDLIFENKQKEMPALQEHNRFTQLWAAKHDMVTFCHLKGLFDCVVFHSFDIRSGHHKMTFKVTFKVSTCTSRWAEMDWEPAGSFKHQQILKAWTHLAT